MAWAAVRSKAVVLLLLTFCLLLLPLWESAIVLCLVVRYFMSILVLQSFWWGRESWLLCLICLPGVLWWLGGSSSRCHGVVWGLWLWYFLIILTHWEYVIKDIVACCLHINHILEYTFMKKHHLVTKTNVAMATNISHLSNIITCY